MSEGFWVVEVRYWTCGFLLSGLPSKSVVSNLGRQGQKAEFEELINAHQPSQTLRLRLGNGPQLFLLRVRFVELTDPPRWVFGNPDRAHLF